MAWISKNPYCWMTRSLERSRASQKEAFARVPERHHGERSSPEGGTDRKKTRGNVMRHWKQRSVTENRDHSLFACSFL